jgi:hypothetical protein
MEGRFSDPRSRRRFADRLTNEAGRFGDICLCTLPT